MRINRWQIRGGEMAWDRFPLLMGIVNATPDSFSDGGKFLAVDAAVAQGVKLVAEGADLLDIGGESTRPGADPVAADEERARVVPVIERLAKAVSVPLSIDTMKANVARAALAAGAHIINDVSGLQSDLEMVDVARAFRAGVVVMHMQGTPQTMQLDPRYDDVVEELLDFFREREATLTEAGLSREQLVWDPGVGFGKTAQHNVQLLNAIPRFRELGRPVLIGHSRKGFLKKILGKPVDERLFGTIGASLAAAQLGADLLRIHDVAANRDALIAFRTVMAGGVEEPPVDPS